MSEFKIDTENFIRHKLYDGETSSWRRYARLVVGSDSVWDLIKYEMTILLFAWVPGALGLKLRQIFYPFLFRSVGSGVIFGRNLVIRNASKISIGDGVVIDDNTVIDARGAGSAGIVIGDQVVVNREVLIISKMGPIVIGSDSDIGTRAMIFSTGGVEIGSGVSIAGDCKLGGVVVKTEGASDDVEKVSKGPVRIGDQATVFMTAIILDGAEVGSRATVGPGVLLRDSVPSNASVVAHQRLVTLRKTADSDDGSEASDRHVTRTQEEDSYVTTPTLKDDATSRRTALNGHSAVLEAVFESIEELNLLRKPEDQLRLAEDTSLSDLESIDKVNLVVEVEDRLRARGHDINLSDSGSVSGDGSIFATVGSFAMYINELLFEKSEQRHVV